MTINKIMNAYNAYCLSEFNHEAGPVPTDGRLGVAYTTIDNNDGYEYEIQVDYDINAQRLEYLQAGALIHSEPWAHAEFIAEIPGAGFDYFYSEAAAHAFVDVLTACRTPYGQINMEIYETFDDILSIDYLYSVTGDNVADALQQLATVSGHTVEVLTMAFNELGLDLEA